jgi:protein TonB
VSENKFLQSLCALLGAAVLVCSVHIFLLVSSAPSLEIGNAKPAGREIKSFAQAVPAEAVKAEPVAAAELPPADPEPVRTAAVELSTQASDGPAGALLETEAKADPELAEAGTARPETVALQSAHASLSEPVEPESTASILEPAPVASAAGESEDLAPAKTKDAIAALIEATSKPIADKGPVKLARASVPGTVPVFDAVDAKGASDEGSAEAAKAATLAYEAPPEPAPPLPVRKPVLKPAPEQPAVASRHMIAETVDVPQVEIAQSESSRPNWQPMSLGFAKDKPAAPTSRARSAPAPKPALSSGAYRSKVWAALARHRPRLGKPGSATVTFTIGAGGGLRGASVSRSSGNSALDARALAAVRSAAPFPAPPAGLSGSALTYAIQIYFR